ncbi:7367_t:CDS:10 [Funneliformis geosporum]|uniref:Spindle assembly checkpoint component MAD1 n=1 Tax=Funneliformis geosporum TaxID=1117311 RepID=A0A9W4WHK3_9GLOM|nr:7367_t:CDS:10 [Funneliformis geosporum]
MSYPPYQRSARKKQIDRLNDNPFRPSSSSSASVPSIFKSEKTQISQPGLGDRPSKRSRLDVESPFRMSSPSITPSRDTFNFMPDLSSLQKSTLNFTSFGQKHDQDLVEARAKIQSLEISKENLELKVGRLEAENKNLDLRSRELILQNEGLIKENNFYNNREKEALHRLGDLEHENTILKQDAVRASQSLEDEIRELQQNLTELKSESQIKENDLTRKLLNSESEASKLLHQIDNLNEQIRQQHDISASRKRQLDETQQRLEVTQEKLNELSMLSGQLDQIETLNKKVQDQSELIQELESKNRDLTREIRLNKQLSPSIQILQHKLEKAEVQLSQMSKLRREAAELEVENAMLKREHVSWVSLLDREGDSINSDTPYNVVNELISRRNEIELLKVKIRSLEEKVKNKDLVIIEYESKIKKLNYKCQAIENKFLNEIEASKGSKELLQVEVEMLRSSLKSYDEEEKHLQSNFDAQKMERIQNLENLLSEYKTSLEQSEMKLIVAQQQKQEEIQYPKTLELDLHSFEVMRINEVLTHEIFELEYEKANKLKEMASLQNQMNIYEEFDLKVRSSELIKQNEVLQETAKELDDDNKSLRVGIVTLDNQFDILDRELNADIKRLSQENAFLRKEFFSLNNKIDALEKELGRDNPASKEFSLRENKFQGLITENQELKDKLIELLKILENQPNITLESTGDNDPKNELRIIPIQSYLNLEEENKQLKSQVADKEKRMTRLKEVWTDKAQEYKEAVYKLLGYKLEFLENSRVRLTSKYSKEYDHSFVFSSENEHGTMQLINGGNTEYIKSQDNLIKYWVVERGSIPCFLSSLTLSLFEQYKSEPINGEVET